MISTKSYSSEMRSGSISQDASARRPPLDHGGRGSDRTRPMWTQNGLQTVTVRQNSAAEFTAIPRGLDHQVIAQRRIAKASRPRISVVVPSRNRRRMLSECLSKLFQQDFSAEKYELIVVDNASTDGTSEMLREMSTRAPCAFRAVSFMEDRGPAVARNLGVVLARGDLVAFTDSDCLPSPGWLRALEKSMSGSAGIVQGKTSADPEAEPKLFSHYIVTTHLDGSFSTSNVCYRRQTVFEAQGFDPACDYWEDTDLGWRVRRQGWKAVFSPQALVHHQVIPLSPLRWLAWPFHFRTMPAKAARYPEYRSHLFMGLWVTRYHALFDLALLSLALGILLHPIFLVLTLPYVLEFPRQHGLGGRFPPVKAAFHFAWDALSFLALLVSSLRYRALVL